MKRIPVLLALSLLTALFTGGCLRRMADQMAFNRRAASSAGFALLTPQQQTRLERGMVEPGDTPEMVYLALGKPDRVERLQQGERWLYEAYLRSSESRIGDAAPVYELGKPTLIQAVAFRDGVVNVVVQRR